MTQLVTNVIAGANAVVTVAGVAAVLVVFIALSIGAIIYLGDRS